jgi:hypothetical protein
MTFRIMSLSIKGLFVTLSIKDTQMKDTQHNKNAIMQWQFSYYYAEYRYAECCYAEYRGAVSIVST